MKTFGAVIVGRNDNYGDNLIERANYCLHSMINSLDEIIFVDWNTEEGKKPLPEELTLPKTKKFSYIVITPKWIEEHLEPEEDRQAVCEVFARNIGLRRLKTDFLISTNVDIICPDIKEIKQYFTDIHAIATVPKRSISLYTLRDQFKYDQVNIEREILTGLIHEYGQQPAIQVCEGDNYSLVSGCGDWQLGHRNVWYHIRGFEESLTGRGYVDSNVQRKASYFGYRIYYEPAVQVWHIGHGAGHGGTGKLNDMHPAIFMEGTSNPETWGFSNIKFKQRRLN